MLLGMAGVRTDAVFPIVVRSWPLAWAVGLAHAAACQCGVQWSLAVGSAVMLAVWAGWLTRALPIFERRSWNAGWFFTAVVFSVHAGATFFVCALAAVALGAWMRRPEQHTPMGLQWAVTVGAIWAMEIASYTAQRDHLFIVPIVGSVSLAVLVGGWVWSLRPTRAAHAAVWGSVFLAHLALMLSVGADITPAPAALGLCSLPLALYAAWRPSRRAWLMACLAHAAGQAIGYAWLAWGG